MTLHCSEGAKEQSYCSNASVPKVPLADFSGVRIAKEKVVGVAKLALGHGVNFFFKKKGPPLDHILLWENSHSFQERSKPKPTAHCSTKFPYRWWEQARRVIYIYILKRN